jgi:hypothetical protein
MTLLVHQSRGLGLKYTLNLINVRIYFLGENLFGSTVNL